MKNKIDKKNNNIYIYIDENRFHYHNPILCHCVLEDNCAEICIVAMNRKRRFQPLDKHTQPLGELFGLLTTGENVLPALSQCVE